MSCSYIVINDFVPWSFSPGFFPYPFDPTPVCCQVSTRLWWLHRWLRFKTLSEKGRDSETLSNYQWVFRTINGGSPHVWFMENPWKSQIKNGWLEVIPWHCFVGRTSPSQTSYEVPEIGNRCAGSKPSRTTSRALPSETCSKPWQCEKQDVWNLWEKISDTVIRWKNDEKCENNHGIEWA